MFGGGRRYRDLQLSMQSVSITSKSCEFEPRSWRDVLDTTLCDSLPVGGFLRVKLTNKIDRHDI